MPHQFKRDLGPFALLLLSFTAMFGSGWLFAPYFAAQIAGPAAILAWVIGALMSMVIGVTMAEVIILHPSAGGINTIAQMTHGKLLGLMTNVIMLIVCVILPTLEVRAIIQYLSSQTQLFINQQGTITLVGYLFAGALLLFINCVNVYGAKMTARINRISFAFKIITPLLIGFAFCITLSKQHALDLSTITHFHVSWQEIFLAISTSGIIFSFNGFNQATLFAAEAKNPSRTIPFAIIGSILVTALLYIFIQCIFLLAVPQSALSGGWVGLHFAGDVGPFSGLAVLLGLHWLLYFIYADAVISPLGTAFAYSSSAPRMIYATAANNHIFPLLRRLNAEGIPTYSVLVSLLLSFIAFIFLPNLKAMISMLVAAFVLNYTVAPVSLLALRQQQAMQVKRTFSVPYAPLFCFLSIFFSEVMAFCSGYESIKNLVIILSLTYLVGLLACLRNRENLRAVISGATWFWMQLLALGAISLLHHQQSLTFTEVIIILFLLALSITSYAYFKHQREMSLELLNQSI